MVNAKLVIFGVTAIGAAVAAAVCAAWAGYKTAEKVKEKDLKTKTETVKETWKYWVPTGAALCVAIVSDICLFRFGLGMIAATGSALTYTMVNRKKLFDKVKKGMDSKEFKEFKKEFTKETVKETVNFRDFNVQHTGYGETLCYFENIDKFFYSSPMEVQRAIANLRYSMKDDKKVRLLDFVDDLHIKMKDFEKFAYDDLGWFAEDIDDSTFDFVDCEMTEGYVPGLPDPCYIITAWCEPYFIEEREFEYGM